MVSLQSSSALLPEATKRPPWLSLVGSVVASSSTGTGTGAAAAATSKKRKRDGSGRDDDDRGEVVDGIELNFDAAPLPPEWQRCLDIKSGQIHYYNTRTQKRTWKDPRGEPDYHAGAAPSAEGDADEEEDLANCAPPGLDLELNLTFEPRRARAVVHEKKKKPKPAAAADDDRRRRLQLTAEEAEDNSGSREMVAGVCVRCHMLVMMCRASPACPNCKFLHPPSRGAAAPPPPPPTEPEPPVPLKLGLQLLCCRD